MLKAMRSSSSKKLKNFSGTSAVSLKSVINPLEVLLDFPLERLCTKKGFLIQFVLPRTSDDEYLYKKLLEAGKQYESVSEVNFIIYKDVLDLIDRLACDLKSVNLPNDLKESAHNFVWKKMQELDALPLDFFALMTKLKIAEVMYMMYSLEVSKMKERKKLNEELTDLLKDCEAKAETKKGGKRGKSPKDKKSGKGKSVKGTQKSTKNKKSLSKISLKQNEPIDSTNLEVNELVLDNNVDNQFMYFILCEFPSHLIIQELININVDVAAIIDISLHSSICDPTQMMQHIEEMFETPKLTYLENTVWMKYRTDKHNSKEILEEFLYVAKKINYIKRQHLRYIQDLKFCNLENNHTESMEKYHRIMDSYPAELVNVALITNAMVRSICWAETQIYTLSDLSVASLDLKEKASDFQAHEDDQLKIQMKIYNEIGRMCYDQSLDYLKLVQPLQKLQPVVKKTLHNVVVSTEDYCCCDNKQDLSDYFHLALFHNMQSKPFEPKATQRSNFSENLVTHSYINDYCKVVPRVNTAMDLDKNELIYNSYHMKEDLSSSVLNQLVFKAVQAFSFCDKSYCEETEATLLRFHDNLDEAGLYTRIWYEHLRTPICLRDFCRFVVNEEKDWLERNKLVEHKNLFDEESVEVCQGLKSLNLEMYEEFLYLLEPSAVFKNNRLIFDEVLNELLGCPKSNSLRSLVGDNGNLEAFDLGPQLCQLSGHTTIFGSDDGVKVTIDTTRFLVEDPRCVVTVEADGCSLVYHNNRPEAFHFILKDETIVSFTKFEENESVELKLEEEIKEEEENHVEPVLPIEELEKQSIYSDYWVELLRKEKISTVVRKISSKTSISDIKTDLDEQNMQRLLELFKVALYTQRPVYKIAKKPSTRFVKPINSELKIPFVHILKKVVFKPVPKRRKIKSYSLLNIPIILKKSPLKYDFKITLPHGLSVETFSRNGEIREIKQSYRYSSHKEKYRSFYTSGMIVIKFQDGTTSIYRCNGDIVDLREKDKKMSSNCNGFNEEECLFHKSRVTSIPKPTTNWEYVKLYDFEEFPYSKKSILTFNGTKIDFNDKVTETQQYYVLNEHDYHHEQIYYEREDGMKCLVDKKGTRTYQFPDGTKLTATLKVEKELRYADNNPKSEGWVCVNVIYTFEHPDYLTVKYNRDESTQMLLKNAALKVSPETLTMFIDKNLALEVSSNSIMLLKSCKLCDADCICKIDLNHGGKLLEMSDSYNKYFSCDNSGKCSMNSDFIRGSCNKNDCNHKWFNDKQQFFVLNKKGAPGTLLWKDSSIESKVAETSKTCRMLNYISKLTRKQTIEFYRKVACSSVKNFTTSCIQSEVVLGKYKHVNGTENEPFFITFRILEEFQRILDYPEITQQIEEFLDRRGNLNDSLSKGLEELLHISDDVFERKSKQEKLSYRVTINEAGEFSETSSRSIESQKIMVQDIIFKWKNACEQYRNAIRNRIFPNYFQSEFYKKNHAAATLKL